MSKGNHIVTLWGVSNAVGLQKKLHRDRPQLRLCFYKSFLVQITLQDNKYSNTILVPPLYSFDPGSHTRPFTQLTSPSASLTSCSPISLILMFECPRVPPLVFVSLMPLVIWSSPDFSPELYLSNLHCRCPTADAPLQIPHCKFLIPLPNLLFPHSFTS